MSWSKATTWNILGFTISFIVMFIVSGSVEVGGIAALAERSIKFPAYVAHEKAWERLKC